MSFYGTMDDAKKFAKAASMQIDGLEPGDTSPVQGGQQPDGSFHLNLEGEKTFTDKRTRPREVGHVTVEAPKRELHSVPIKKGGVL
jgi:hypothetical protein